MSQIRKTKIICTLGPATDDPEVLRQLMINGMDVARVNFSHQTHPEHLERIRVLKKMREELHIPVALLADTKGPEIRLGKLEPNKITLNEGQTFTLTTVEIIGNEQRASISFEGLPHDVSRGSTILIDDGLIELVVESVSDTDITCRVVNGGEISSNKGVNVPGVELSMPFVSGRDRADIRFAVENDFDFIAASFTRTAQDIMLIRE